MERPNKHERARRASRETPGKTNFKNIGFNSAYIVPSKKDPALASKASALAITHDFTLSGSFMYIFAERLSSAMEWLGAEHAARSMIRDKPFHSL
jgi:hypothetical protein